VQQEKYIHFVFALPMTLSVDPRYFMKHDWERHEATMTLHTTLHDVFGSCGESKTVYFSDCGAACASNFGSLKCRNELRFDHISGRDNRACGCISMCVLRA
jgi:hypothetical protein